MERFALNLKKIHFSGEKYDKIKKIPMDFYLVELSEKPFWGQGAGIIMDH